MTGDLALGLALFWLVRRVWPRGGRKCRWHPTRVQYRTEYLHGRHWAKFRHDWWVQHPDAVCRDCGAGHPLDLHHLSYEHIGHEHQGDVIPLCRRCHDRRHHEHLARTGRWAA